jgi:hypothetical protein
VIPSTRHSVVNVSTEHRLKRLRDLLHELERLPATAERDQMIREVRARVVDVDTGVLPSALLPVYHDSVAAERGSPITPAPRVPAAMPADERREPRATALPEPAKPARVPPSEAAAAAGEEIAADSPTDAGDRLRLAADELLSLDDSSFSQSEPAAAPWTRGLRG